MELSEQPHGAFRAKLAVVARSVDCGESLCQGFGAADRGIKERFLPRDPRGLSRSASAYCWIFPACFSRNRSAFRLLPSSDAPTWLAVCQPSGKLRKTAENAASGFRV